MQDHPECLTGGLCPSDCLAFFFLRPITIFLEECVGGTGKSRNFAAEFLTPKNNNENKNVQETDDEGRQVATQRAADGQSDGQCERYNEWNI